VMPNAELRPLTLVTARSFPLRCHHGGPRRFQKVAYWSLSVVGARHLRKRKACDLARKRRNEGSRRFKSTPLHHTVHQFLYLSENRSKFAGRNGP
jgi:hypothetical protein